MTNNTQTPTQNAHSEEDIKAAVEAMLRHAAGVPQTAAPASTEKAPAPTQGSK